MKLNQSNLKIWASALAFVTLAGLASCQSTTAPSEVPSQQAYDSQAAADVTATAIGTKTGGANAILSDALAIGKGGTVSSTEELGKNSPQSRDSSYDPVTMIHTITFTRAGGENGFSFNGKHVYTYIFYDASGATMSGFQKGVTDKLVITERGNHNASTPRATIIDSSNGNWTLTGLASTTADPVLNGTFNRAGQSTISTTWNPSRTITHTFTINYTNDVIKRDLSGELYLVGQASSSFAAAGPKNSFSRTIAITFNDDATATTDATATLLVTRTSGDGTIDTFTIDVKQGFWLRDGR
jgi:hypothetical protein